MPHPSKHSLLKKLSFLTLFLLVGFFGVAEKSWGAESCGNGTQGKVGICLSKCQAGSGYLSYSYDKSTDCKLSLPSTTVCCIEECLVNNEGSSCKSGSGTCLNKKCETSNGSTGDYCGSNSGICTELKNDEACASGLDTGGRSCDENNGNIENPVALACCVEGKVGKDKPKEAYCGTNSGICSTEAKCSTGYQHDSGGDSTCTSPGWCCYKPAADPDTTSKKFEYKNPLGTIESFTAWAEKVLTSIQGIVGWLAVIMIMIGGIVYLTSAGTNQAALGKEIITAALIGFSVAVAGPSLLKEIKDVASTSGTTASDAIDSAKDIKSIFTSVLDFLLTAMGTLALIGFAIGGFFYLTAFGDKGKAETGKKMAINSLYAIALAGGGLILVKQILSLLGS